MSTCHAGAGRATVSDLPPSTTRYDAASGPAENSGAAASALLPMTNDAVPEFERIRDQSHARGLIAVGNKGDPCMGRRYGTERAERSRHRGERRSRQSFSHSLLPRFWPASTVGAIAGSERPETPR